MDFGPTIGTTLVIDGATYRFLAHPSSPRFVHGLDGREAVVYRLSGDDDCQHALKVFKPRYRVPSLVSLSEQVTQLASLPGLRASRRIVLDEPKHARLVVENPDLLYSLLMPWIEGPTWWDLLTAKLPLRKEQALPVASDLARALASLEQRGLAHGDISAANVLLPGLNAPNGQFAVELVDLEQLYAAGLDAPENVSCGSPGYAYPSGEDCMWGPLKDRFAGAVLLSEILCWPSEKARSHAYGESFFDPGEMQRECERAGVMREELAALWGSGPASCFERTWASRTLAACPTFAEWMTALSSLETRGADRAAKERGELEIESLLKTADLLVRTGDSVRALDVYRQAQARTVPYSPLWDLVAGRIDAVRGAGLTSSTSPPGSSADDVPSWDAARARPGMNWVVVGQGAAFLSAGLALAAIARIFAPKVQTLSLTVVARLGNSIAWALGAMLVCALLGILQAIAFRTRLAPAHRVTYVAVSTAAGALAGLAAGYLWSRGIIPDARAGAVLGALAGLISSCGHVLLIGGRGRAKWVVWSTMSGSAIWYSATSLTWTADLAVAVALGGGLVLVLTGICHVAFLRFVPEVEF